MTWEGRGLPGRRRRMRAMTLICTAVALLAVPTVSGATDARRHTCPSFALSRLSDPTTVIRVTMTRSARAPCKSFIAKVRTLTDTEYPVDSPAQRVNAHDLTGGWDCFGDVARLICRGSRRHPGYNTLRVPGVAKAQAGVAIKTIVELPRPRGPRRCAGSRIRQVTAINLSCAQSSQLLDSPFADEWHREASNFVTDGPDGPVGNCAVIHMRSADRAVVMPAIAAGEPDLSRIGDRPVIIERCGTS